MKPSPSVRSLVEALHDRFHSNGKEINTVIDLVVLMAKADGRIDDDEMKALGESFEVMLGSRLAPIAIYHLVKASQAKLEAAGAGESLEAIGAALAAHDAAEDGVRLALAMAWTNHDFSDAERARVEALAHAAGVSPARFEQLAVEARPAA